MGGPPEANEHEMEEPPDVTPDVPPDVDTTEENLELMPEADEPLDAIVGDNDNEMEMPEMGTKRPRDDDEMTEDSTKILRTRLKEGITRAWQKAKETKGEKSAIAQLENLHVLRVPIKAEYTMPRHQTDGSSAYDVCTARSCTLQPGQTQAILLNLRLAVPRGYTLLLKSRSGSALKGITTLGGVIDSDYRGPIKAILFNSTSKPFKIKKGPRVSQAIFLKHIEVTFVENNDEDLWHNDTHHGFGSTGCLY